MGTWRIDPNIDFTVKDDGKTIEINFGENKGDNQTYVVTYTDDLGNCGKTTIVHQGGCGGGGGDTCTLDVYPPSGFPNPVPKEGSTTTYLFTHSQIHVTCTISNKSFDKEAHNSATLATLPLEGGTWRIDQDNDSNSWLKNVGPTANSITGNVNSNSSEGSRSRTASFTATCTNEQVCSNCHNKPITFTVTQAGTSGPDTGHIRFIIRNESVDGGNGFVNWVQAPVYYNGDVIAYYTDDGNWRQKDGLLNDADEVQLYFGDKPSISTTCNQNYVFTQKKLDVGQSIQVDVAIGNGVGEIPSTALGKYFVKSGSQTYEELHYGGGNPAVKLATIVKAAEKLVEDEDGRSRYGNISRCQRCVDSSRAYIYARPIKDANGGGNTIIAGHTYYIDIFGTRVDKTPFINSTDTSYEIFNAPNRADATPPPICKFSYDGKCYKPAKRSDGKWATSTETQCPN